MNKTIILSVCLMSALGAAAASTDAKEMTEDAVMALNPGYVSMDGQAVYRFAVKTVPAALEDAIEQAGMTADDIDLFVLHQANIRIIESVSKRLKQPMEKFPTNLQELQIFLLALPSLINDSLPFEQSSS